MIITAVLVIMLFRIANQAKCPNTPRYLIGQGVDWALAMHWQGIRANYGTVNGSVTSYGDAV